MSENEKSLQALQNESERVWNQFQERLRFCVSDENKINFMTDLKVNELEIELREIWHRMLPFGVQPKDEYARLQQIDKIAGSQPAGN